MNDTDTATSAARIRSTLRKVDSTVGAIVDNWISVPAWYMMITAIGLTPGKPLNKLARREWNASR